MARTDLTVQQVVSTGLTPATEAVNFPDGEMFLNDGHVFLRVVNGSGAGLTVTILTAQTVDGLDVADRAVSVPAGQERWIGPLSQTVYNQSDGKVYADFSAGTTITVAAIRAG